MNKRIDYLDAARAFALLLGIVFHAALSFSPVYLGWAVMDVSVSPLILDFLLVSHSFRMPLFFMLAGFFSHMTFYRRGPGEFVNTRLVRLGIPFMIGWFILRPLMVPGWAMGAQSMQGEVDILGGLKTGFASFSELPHGIFAGSHLWFLYYLLLITALVLGARAILGSLGIATIRARLDSLVSSGVRSPVALPVLSLPTAACVWFMSGWGMDTPDKSLVPQLPVLMVYGGAFSLGWLVHRQQGLIEVLTRISGGRLALCCASIAASLVLVNYQADLGHPYIGMIHAGFVFSYALMMWTLVALCIGLFRCVLDRPNRAVRYIADASYWLYLIHLPIVIWLQIAVAELPIHWSLKLVMVSVLTVGIALVLYDLFVRTTVIGKTLNGRRKERELFKRVQAEQRASVA